MKLANTKKGKIIAAAVGAVLLLLLLLMLMALKGPPSSGADDPLPDVYPEEPEENIFVSCDNEKIIPETITLEAGTFVKIFFTNEGTFEQRFGIRLRSGEGVNSTRAIVTDTKANFSWRVPEEEFTAEMYCSDNPDRAWDLLGTLRVEFAS